MPTFLSPLGVSAAEERVYRRVLREAPTTVTALASVLGWPQPQVRDAVTVLLDRGLLVEDPDGHLEADDPRVGIGRLVDARLAEVARTRVELERSRNAIAHFAADRATSRGEGRRPTWEVVPADLMSGVVLESIQATTGTIRSGVISADWSPDGIDQVLDLARRTIASGREMRALYPMATLASESSRTWMRRFAEVGEVQRLVREPLSEFVVLGDEMVIAATVWGSLEADYVKLRDPMLVQAFLHLYELAWAGGLVPPDDDADDADERRLLTLLAAGHKDEAIARHLGVSLRTVRRRVATLMEKLGVTTRFQLGMTIAAQTPTVRPVTRPTRPRPGGPGGW